MEDGTCGGQVKGEVKVWGQGCEGMEGCGSHGYGARACSTELR